MSTDKFPIDDCSGATISIYLHELQLLRRIAESASDFRLGKCDPEFAEINGGLDSLYNTLAQHVGRYETWVSEFDE